MRTLLARVIFASSASRHQSHEPCLRCRSDRHCVQQKAEQRGFNVLGDSQRTIIPFTSVDIVTTRGFINDQSPLIENMSATVELIMKKLRLKDTLTAEEGYHDAVRTMSRKPYPAIEGMRNIQRLLKTQNPRIGDVDIEDLVDNRYIRKLDESGFFERIYAK